MAQQFTGTVEILNGNSGKVTIVLEGGDDERGGNIIAGGNGDTGDLALLDQTGKQRVFMSAGQCFLRLEENALKTIVYLDGQRGHIMAGGFGQNGSLAIRNAAGTEVVRLDGANGEVVIKDWSLSVPDYVFAPGYDLRPLDEVEHHVAANRHLPGVPSAEAIERDGVGLASMCMLLLKQVEELTLHAIRHEKAIRAQADELDQLRADVARLRGT